MCLNGCDRSPAPEGEIDAVFLIVVDALRPDGLSCYGYTGHETPAIDRIAAAGVRFEQAHSVASWTVPSMGAMLTSRYPTQLGLIERPPRQNKRFEWREKRNQILYTLPPGVPTLASLLGDAGFHSVAFINQPFINVQDGFLQGFDQWCYTTGERTIEWHDPITPIPSIEFPPRTDLGRADALLVAEFSNWLEENAGNRPFVWLHLLKPHWPYTPLLRHVPDHLKKPGANVHPRLLYEAEIRETDELIQAVLDAIDTHVGLDRSLLIFTSDHGEEFGDHRMAEHGHSLHSEVVHVPLIIVGPSLPAGKKIESYVRTIDLLPTVLSIVNADPPTPPGIEGASLLPLVDGHRRDRVVYSEGMLYGSTERSLIADGYKLMFDAQELTPYRLFDIVADPLETTDIFARETRRVDQLREQLGKQHARLVDDYESLLGPAEVEVDPEIQRILRAMRALGYVSE
jgi:arylsulfatase A-like enzyme